MNGASWIQTVSGRRLDPLNPEPNVIDFGDIAHALSNLCRFAGHTSSFYSVAQHSVIVSQLVELNHPGNARLRLAGLLHDGSEAYLVDIPRPAKRHMPDYAALERMTQEAVFTRFGLTMDLLDLVKEADERALVVEAHSFMGDVSDWGLPAYSGARMEAWGPARAEAEMHRTYDQIGRIA